MIVEVECIPPTSMHIRKIHVYRPYRIIALCSKGCQQRDSQLPQMIKHAIDVCDNQNDTAAECAVAWDGVDELYRALIRKDEMMFQDPLEKLCEQEPDLDECKIYDI